MPAVANAGSDTFYAFGAGPAYLDLNGSGTGVITAEYPSGAPIVKYDWRIVSWPDGSTPTFADTGTTISSKKAPRLQGLPDLGDVVLCLIVTDINGKVSEAEYSLMPRSAVIVVGITTENTAIRRLSESERFYAEAMQGWVDAIDSLSASLAGAVGQNQPDVQRALSGSLVGVHDFAADPYVDLDIVQGSAFEIVAMVSIEIDAGLTYLLEIVAGPAGGTLIPVCTEDTPVAGPANQHLSLRSLLTVDTVGASGGFSWLWEAKSGTLDVDSFGEGTSGVVNLSGGKLRLNVRLTVAGPGGHTTTSVLKALSARSIGK